MDFASMDFCRGRGRLLDWSVDWRLEAAVWRMKMGNVDPE